VVRRSELEAYPRHGRQPGVEPQLLVWPSEDSGVVTGNRSDRSHRREPEGDGSKAIERETSRGNDQNLKRRLATVHEKEAWITFIFRILYKM